MDGRICGVSYHPRRPTGEYVIYAGGGQIRGGLRHLCCLGPQLYK
nr:MAG TPA: hypothetical protein [Caudoviricetes sp.]